MATGRIIDTVAPFEPFTKSL
ncbi:MAG: hypothetical protein QOJ42_5245, partial [Acidobacteriaceae bacterium]|nr:hypothetical protein [Acidobacteriaceae bacterium]